jgi:hypothetical protein
VAGGEAGADSGAGSVFVSGAGVGGGCVSFGAGAMTTGGAACTDRFWQPEAVKANPQASRAVPKFRRLVWLGI